MCLKDSNTYIKLSPWTYTQNQRHMSQPEKICSMSHWTSPEGLCLLLFWKTCWSISVFNSSCFSSVIMSSVTSVMAQSVIEGISCNKPECVKNKYHCIWNTLRIQNKNKLKKIKIILDLYINDLSVIYDASLSWH